MLEKIKKLRAETGVGIMDARKALLASKGNMDRARKWVAKNAVIKAGKKANRSTEEGAIFSYVHQTGKIAVLVKLGCETDFVAKTDDFKTLGKEIAMQVASMNPNNIDELLKQEWIRDASKTIEQIVKEDIAKTGENIKILEFVRMKL